MSPEELRGEKPTESWDLWALAVVTYEMLAGVHPFTGSTVSEIRIAILDGRMTPLQAHLPDATQTLQQFFNKALAFDPANRPSSALQLLSYFRLTLMNADRRRRALTNSFVGAMSASASVLAAHLRDPRSDRAHDFLEPLNWTPSSPTKRNTCAAAIPWWSTIQEQPERNSFAANCVVQNDEKTAFGLAESGFGPCMAPACHSSILLGKTAIRPARVVKIGHAAIPRLREPGSIFHGLNFGDTTILAEVSLTQSHLQYRSICTTGVI